MRHTARRAAIRTMAGIISEATWHDNAAICHPPSHRREEQLSAVLPNC
jgi:hypothetical protein